MSHQVEALAVVVAAPAALPTLADTSGASSDAHLVNLWLSSKASMHTRRAYAADAARFLLTVGKPLALVTVADVQAFASSLTGASRSQARTLGAAKSLLSFGHRVGYLAFDVGRVVKAAPAKDTLGERILSEEEAIRLIALSAPGRDRAMVRLMYAAGIRVAELCGLSWCDVQKRGEDAGQITVLGKGAKTRTVLLTPAQFGELVTMRGDAADTAPVFCSRTGRRLDPSAVLRVVKRAALAAGIDRPVSPHWFRHSHASHAIERGAPIHLVQATLGHSSVATTGRYLHARPSDSSARYLVV